VRKIEPAPYEPDERLSHLMGSYPRLFHSSRPLSWSDVEPGWFSIADKLFRKIDALLTDEQAAVFEVQQIKEKMAHLVVHVSRDGLSEKINEQISNWRLQAWEQSGHTCQVCGAAGKTDWVTSGWAATLCEPHFEERRKGQPVRHDQRQSPSRWITGD
jgi:hypothetical protein